MHSFTVTFLTLFSGAMCLALFVTHVLRAREAFAGEGTPGAPLTSGSPTQRIGRKLLPLCLFLVVLGARIGLAGQGFELAVDAGTFRAWAHAAARLGVHGLYASPLMVDYPPVYLGILGIFGSVASAAGLAFDSPLFARLLVLGPLAFEVATAYAVGRLIRSRRLWLFMSAWLLLPHAVANASFFGQVDAAPTFWLVMASLALAAWLARCSDATPTPQGTYQSKHGGSQRGTQPARLLWASALLFGVALMTKPIALLFGPLGGAAVTAGFLMTPAPQRRSVLLAIGGSCLVFLGTLAVILALAAGFQGDLALIIVNKYLTTLGSYPYASLNAANLWSFVGKNWADVHESLFSASVIGSPLAESLTITVLGKVLVGLSVVVTFGLSVADLRSRHRQTQRMTDCETEIENQRAWPVQVLPFLESLCFFGALQMTLIFTLSDQMHERYLYPGATLLVLAAILRPNGMTLGLAGAQSLLVALNQSLFLDYHAATHGYHVSAQEPWLLVLSTCHLVFSSVFVWCALPVQRNRFLLQRVSLDPFLNFNVKTQSPQAREGAFFERPWFGSAPPIRKNEAAFVSGLTVVAAVLGFFQLGSCDSPQTFWRPRVPTPDHPQTTPLEEAKLTRRYEMSPPVAADELRITGFFGLGKGAYRFRVSTDGLRWQTLGSLGHDTIFDPFAWKVLNSSTSQSENGSESESVAEQNSAPFRFLEISALPVNGDTVAFHEVGVFSSTEFNDPARRIVLAPLNPAEPQDALIDEPGTIPMVPSYLNEMIFDEVYHVRSAYEEILGLSITETSHPPFGKTLISFGISVFGNTPFGWRVVGALLGVLLVPMTWIFLRLLTGLPVAAGLAAFLFCFDFLRFSQTRMATLDGMVVFFVLATLTLILIYGRRNCASPPQQSFSPLPRMGLLLLTGTVFGLGIATKWSVIYLLPVLLVLWFCFEIHRCSLEVSPSLNESILSQLLKRGMLQSTGCALFCLMAWPLFLYYGAFVLSHLRSGEAWGLSDFWERQVSMYRYHSELKATHPFSSRWWEWPIIKRPLWLYTGEPSPAELGDSKVRSIVAMGSPLIWWSAMLAVVVASAKSLGVMIRNLGAALLGKTRTSQVMDFGIFLLLLAFFGLYSPWIVSPRSLTFIYHFFPVVPFALMILSVVVVQPGSSWNARPWTSTWVLLPAWVALASFVLFFPVLSGIPIDRSFINAYLRWFPSWIF